MHENPKPIFEEARADTGRKGQHKSAKKMLNGAFVAAGKHVDPLISATQFYADRVRREVDAELQHGPVRVLVKDGNKI